MVMNNSSPGESDEISADQGDETDHSDFRIESFTVPQNLPGNPRIDKYITDHLQLFPRSQLNKRSFRIMANGKTVKPSRKVNPGDRITCSYTDLPEITVQPENIDFDVIYEDANCIVINKPPGMVVHPGAGVSSGTLVQGLMGRYKGFQDAFGGDSIRPGIVHRLDKDTSGVIIAAKNWPSLEYLSSQFKVKTTGKIYFAIVKGSGLPNRGRIDQNIARDTRNRKRFQTAESRGKRAVTNFRVLKRWDDFSFVQLVPETGRTHQLRVHMLSLGCPIVGDPVYSRKDPFGLGLMLHAYSLSIAIPEQEPYQYDPSGSAAGIRKKFRAVLPVRFRTAMAELSR